MPRRAPQPRDTGAEGICETSPVNILDTIDGARRVFELAGRGCLVRLGEEEPHYATVEEPPALNLTRALRCCYLAVREAEDQSMNSFGSTYVRRNG